MVGMILSLNPNSEVRGAVGDAMLGCTRRWRSQRLYPIDTVQDRSAACAANDGGECGASNFGVRVKHSEAIATQTKASAIAAVADASPTVAGAPPSSEDVSIAIPESCASARVHGAINRTSGKYV